MYIDKWVNGYKVSASDWYDGNHIYFNISYYRPGASIARPPVWEKSFLISKADENKVKMYLDSVTNHFAAVTEEKEMLSYYINGKLVVDRGCVVA